MTTRRRFLTMTGAAGLMLGARLPAQAQSMPAGYPANYADIIAAAKKEGAVSIYTSTDQVQGKPFVDAFQAAYPGIKVEYNDLGTNGTYNRVISEAAAKQVGSDIVWSSAMDLQMVLLDKGYAEAYASPEAKNLPAWASYKNTLYGNSVEPIAILYNKSGLGALPVPKTRADLIKLLRDNKEALKGKVASMDPEKSGAGFLHFTNDVREQKDAWDLIAAFGATDAKVYGSSGNIREKITSGEHIIAFNIIGSYALEWAKKNPNLGVVLTSDFTAAFSRVVNISKGAPHPNAAKLWIDFMLSQKGQSILSANGAPSIRADVTEGVNIAKLNEMAGGKLKPIALDEHLLVYADPKKRAEFFQQWKKTLRG